MEPLKVKTPSGIEVVFQVKRGELYITGSVPSRKVSGSAGRPQPIALRDGATHKVSIGTAGVGFAAAEAAQIADWMTAAEAEIAASPEATRRRLLSERRDLVSKIQGGHEDASRANARAWERGDEARSFGTFDDSALRAQLRDFDLAHPEVIGSIEAERAEAARRYLAAN